MRRPQIAEFCGLFWAVLTEQSRTLQDWLFGANRACV